MSDPVKAGKAIKGLAEYYDNLFSHQLAIFYGVPVEWARKIKSKSITYEQVPEEFRYRDRINIGGLGSGKTVAALYTLLCLSAYQPDNLGIIVRKRWDELRTHILDELERLATQICDGNPRYLISEPEQIAGTFEVTVFTRTKPSKILIKPEPDGTDSQVEAAFKGPEHGWFFADELTQLRQITFQTLQGRLRRSEVKVRAGIACTNPPFRGQWLYESNERAARDEMNGQKPKILVVRSSMMDNPHLPADYIAAQTALYENDPIRFEMLINGQDGVEVEGKPVFGSAFTTRHHVDPTLRVNPHAQVLVGLDFGWHRPAAVFLQKDDRGRLNGLFEILGSEQTAEQFGREIKDFLRVHFPGNKSVSYFGDPAGRQKSDKGDTTLQILGKMGIRVASRASTIESGLDLTRSLLGDFREGRPRLVVHPRCQLLIQGFTGGYHYDKFSDGRLSPTPKKDGIFDHLFDALRYCLIHVCGDYAGEDRYKRGAITRQGMAKRKIA